MKLHVPLITPYSFEILFTILLSILLFSSLANGVSKAKNYNANGTGTGAIANEWGALFGDEVLSSKFQDGHYVYTVVDGGGTGNDVYPPTIYVADVESAVDFNNVLMP